MVNAVAINVMVQCSETELDHYINANGIIHNRDEMQSSLEEIAGRLKMNQEYRVLFRKAYEGTADTAITPYAIQKAITEFEKQLLSFNSRFDRYLRGDMAQLSQKEINGYTIFAGKALCGSCHFFPLVNGTVPPFFRESEYEVIGTPADSTNKQIDEDKGRMAVTRLSEQLHAFKTPTLRNIALTAPYVHNGVYTSLEQVLEFCHKGGGKGLGYEVPNQTLPFDSLQLSKSEKEDIILFLKTLTDTSLLSHLRHH